MIFAFIMNRPYDNELVIANAPDFLFSAITFLFCVHP